MVGLASPATASDSCRGAVIHNNNFYAFSYCRANNANRKGLPGQADGRTLKRIGWYHIIPRHYIPLTLSI